MKDLGCELEHDQNIKVVKHILKYLHAEFGNENTSFNWANPRLKSFENTLNCPIEIQYSFGQFPSITTLHISPKSSTKLHIA